MDSLEKVPEVSDSLPSGIYIKAGRLQLRRRMKVRARGLPPRIEHGVALPRPGRGRAFRGNNESGLPRGLRKKLSHIFAYSVVRNTGLEDETGLSHLDVPAYSGTIFYRPAAGALPSRLKF